MKQEEKAKAYDEALAKAKEQYKYPCMRSCMGILEEIFPELAESGDEKVMKEIIELVMQPIWKTEEEFHRRNELCAWLENVPVTIDHEKREGFHLGYRACLEKRGEQNPADSYCQENCKGFQETGKCFADGECKAKREAEQNLAENAKPQSSTPMSYGKELEKRMYEACNRFFAPNTDSNRYSASDLFYAGVKAERDLNTLAWSEEDDKMLNDAIGAVAAADYYTLDDKQDIENWLQSLKDRVQPKQKWSEEDEEILRTILSDGIRGAELDMLQVNWLKSLRPQNTYNPYKAVVESIAEMCKHYDKASNSGLRDFYDNVKVKCKDAQEYDKMFPQAQWKPSDEQMGCLSDAIEHYNSLGYPAPKLKELLDDLKKLKEGKV